MWRGLHAEVVRALSDDHELINGLLLSLRSRWPPARGSVVMGTLAAFALVKYRRFRGRTLFSGMVNAPLVMPEVVVGLSLLLMLVSVQRLLGFPERGVATIWLGHLLLGMAYATVVIQARLLDLNPQLEEAARDLGAPVAGVLAGHAAHDRAEHGVGLAAHVHHLARRRGVVGLPVGPRLHPPCRWSSSAAPAWA